MSLSQRIKTKSAAQLTCNICKRFLPPNHICTFCRADNSTSLTLNHHVRDPSDVFHCDLLTSAEGDSLVSSRYRSLSDMMLVLLELKSMVSCISARMNTLETKLISMLLSVPLMLSARCTLRKNSKLRRIDLSHRQHNPHH